MVTNTKRQKSAQRHVNHTTPTGRKEGQPEQAAVSKAKSQPKSPEYSRVQALLAGLIIWMTRE